MEELVEVRVELAAANREAVMSPPIYRSAPGERFRGPTFDTSRWLRTNRRRVTGIVDAPFEPAGARSSEEVCGFTVDASSRLSPTGCTANIQLACYSA